MWTRLNLMWTRLWSRRESPDFLLQNWKYVRKTLTKKPKNETKQENLRGRIKTTTELTNANQKQQENPRKKIRKQQRNLVCIS